MTTAHIGNKERIPRMIQKIPDAGTYTVKDKDHPSGNGEYQANGMTYAGNLIILAYREGMFIHSPLINQRIQELVVKGEKPSEVWIRTVAKIRHIKGMEPSHDYPESFSEDKELILDVMGGQVVSEKPKEGFIITEDMAFYVFPDGKEVKIIYRGVEQLHFLRTIKAPENFGKEKGCTYKQLYSSGLSNVLAEKKLEIDRLKKTAGYLNQKFIKYNIPYKIVDKPEGYYITKLSPS